MICILILNIWMIQYRKKQFAAPYEYKNNYNYILTLLGAVTGGRWKTQYSATICYKYYNFLVEYKFPHTQGKRVRYIFLLYSGTKIVGKILVNSKTNLDKAYALRLNLPILFLSLCGHLIFLDYSATFRSIHV